MRRLAAFTVLALLTIFAVPAFGWTLDDCVEVNWDHPDCDQYPTTTAYQTTTTAEVTTTTVEVTTTTEPEVTTTTAEVTTTTTPNETTTTVEQQETTTTTAAPCAEGLIHQPPLCVPPPDDTPTNPQIVTVPTTPEGETVLPFTGDTSALLALFSSLFLTLGLVVSMFVRKEVT